MFKIKGKFIELLTINQDLRVSVIMNDSETLEQVTANSNESWPKSIETTNSTPTVKTFSAMSNNGIPDNTWRGEESSWSNQCFWISISDWYKIKKSEEKTVSELKAIARPLSNRLGLNENDQQMVIFNNEPNSPGALLVKEFAEEQDIYIRIFSYDRNNNKLQLGDCKRANLQNCLGRYFDFGNKTNASEDNTIYIISYGLSHFELITKIDQGVAHYNINDDHVHEINDDDSIKYYDDYGTLVVWNSLTPTDKEKILKQQEKIERAIKEHQVDILASKTEDIVSEGGGSLSCCKKDCQYNREQDSFFCLNHSINSILDNKKNSHDFIFN
jgi:hypothetical protein